MTCCVGVLIPLPHNLDRLLEELDESSSDEDKNQKMQRALETIQTLKMKLDAVRML